MDSLEYQQSQPLAGDRIDANHNENSQESDAHPERETLDLLRKRHLRSVVSFRAQERNAQKGLVPYPY
jgi:hypothetical protein